MTKIYVFPGQGSQSIGMGASLFDSYQDLTAKASDLLGYDIKALCLQDPNHVLGQTEFTQPALYVVNALSYLNHIKTSGKPDYVAGHSLGEYNALFAAEIFDFITGLKLVKKRGELMKQASGGSMAAVIGLNAEIVAQEVRQYPNLDIANYNSPTQTVISGKKEDIANITPKLQQKGAQMVIPLKVSAAFHSRFMTPAAEEFGSFLTPFTFNSPKIPVIANIDAKPYSFASIHKNLATQINHSVQWLKTIEFLLQQPEPVFTEIGPGKVLTGLIQQIQRAHIGSS